MEDVKDGILCMDKLLPRGLGRVISWEITLALCYQWGRLGWRAWEVLSSHLACQKSAIFCPFNSLMHLDVSPTVSHSFFQEKTGTFEF
jgi:hypothetical protein